MQKISLLSAVDVMNSVMLLTFSVLMILNVKLNRALISVSEIKGVAVFFFSLMASAMAASGNLLNKSSNNC